VKRMKERELEKAEELTARELIELLNVSSY
jgi:hypothetical protein